MKKQLALCAALAAFYLPVACSPVPSQPVSQAAGDQQKTKSGEDDWRRFRGPGGNAVSTESGLPVKWSATESIAWKTALPGPGASSPITCGHRIFITCYSGYGDKGEDSDQKHLKRHLVCLNRGDGKILWNKAVPSASEVAHYSGFIKLHGYASHTPACDDERVYVFFGTTGVLAFDFNGKQLWQTKVGTRTHGFGTGTSVVLYKNLVIVNACVESNRLVALDRDTGKVVWQADNVAESWNTPVLVESGAGMELVVDTQDKLRGFDPASGQLLWHCSGSTPPRYICPSPVAAAGIIYAVHGYNGPLSAVRPGGRGDVTASHRLWTVGRSGSNVPSPVFHGGYLYTVNESGRIVCVDKEGKVIYRENLEPRPGLLYGSPVAADGKLYFVSREDGTYVVAAGPKFRVLAHNVIADDDSIFNGSPVVSRGQLLLRSDRYLYCIGKAAPK